MKQTKWESLEETLVNVGTGFLMSLFIQVAIVPMITGHYPSATQNFVITLIFTVISILRGFTVRRVYNKHRGIFIKIIRRLIK